MSIYLYIVKFSDVHRQIKRLRYSYTCQDKTTYWSLLKNPMNPAIAVELLMHCEVLGHCGSGGCHEPAGTFVTRGAPPASTRRRPVPLHLVRGLCDSRACLAQSRPLRPYAKRLHRGLVAGDGAHLADAQAGNYGSANCLLVPNLFGACD